ncbi:MAG: hypothetical protein CMI55_03270 [Parcubacteria group bacterium]|jgi:addiction module RelE/StbE family toxin|nr:hypothetical protein [Parcubacteria group bacterium]|tara:strand:- start:16250 stop:16519 length:270 start_codon:yes stop_codon:yes gene_type:complete
MKILYSSKFIRGYKKLPDEAKKLAEKKEKVFRQNPFSPELKTHKLHGKFKGKIEKYWSFSIGYKYRIVFRFTDKNTVRFYLIGTHRIYQ